MRAALRLSARWFLPSLLLAAALTSALLLASTTSAEADEAVPAAAEVAAAAAKESADAPPTVTERALPPTAEQSLPPGPPARQHSDTPTTDAGQQRAETADKNEPQVRRGNEAESPARRVVPTPGPAVRTPLASADRPAPDAKPEAAQTRPSRAPRGRAAGAVASTEDVVVATVSEPMDEAGMAVPEDTSRPPLSGPTQKLLPVVSEVEDEIASAVARVDRAVEPAREVSLAPLLPDLRVAEALQAASATLSRTVDATVDTVKATSGPVTTAPPRDRGRPYVDAESSGTLHRYPMVSGEVIGVLPLAASDLANVHGAFAALPQRHPGSVPSPAPSSNRVGAAHGVGTGSAGGGGSTATAGLVGSGWGAHSSFDGGVARHSSWMWPGSRVILPGFAPD